MPPVTAVLACLQVPNERGVATGVVMDHGRGAKQHDGITKALQLTPVQRKTLSWIRERQISKIADLTEARRELNMRVCIKSQQGRSCAQHVWGG